MGLLDDLKALILKDDVPAEPVAPVAPVAPVLPPDPLAPPVVPAVPVAPLVTPAAPPPVIPDTSVADLQAQVDAQAAAMKLLEQRPTGTDAPVAPPKMPKLFDLKALTERVEQELKETPGELPTFTWTNPDPIEVPNVLVVGRGGPDLI